MPDPNIAAMAEELTAKALWIAHVRGCNGLDQYAHARELCAADLQQTRLAAHSTWWAPTVRKYQVRIEALERAMTILDDEEQGYIARSLAALASRPTRLPQRGTG